MPEQRAYDMVAVVHETVVNAVRPGGGRGVVRLRSDPLQLICEVRDYGPHSPAALPELPAGCRPGHGTWRPRDVAGTAQTAAGRVNS